MNPTTQRRLFLGGALMVASLALGVVSFADIGENLVYYWDPTQLEEAGDKALGADIRLGGVVVAGSLQWDEASGELSFEVSDNKNTVEVHNSGAPPAMFREGIGVVVEGTLTSAGVFESDRLMVKHSNEYRAPEEGVESTDLYKTVEEI
ncbi:MAG: cytochrome c-type biogenesis protein CcmE [Myxococcota bacterium]|jgi:cytochrome c-type biogenesis protein CcmE